VSSMRGPFSHRHYEVQDVNGNLLGSGSALWVVLDMETHKPVRIQADHLPIFPERLPICGLAGKVPSQPLEEDAHLYQVKFSDLDLVGHVNNVRYLHWMLDHMPDAWHEQPMSWLEVNYLGESFLHDPLRLHFSPHPSNSNLHLIQICRPDNDEVVCRASWGSGASL
ncbi:MAG: hypothetical protein AAF206_25345, partial [Bacteroidota bacterium]